MPRTVGQTLDGIPLRTGWCASITAACSRPSAGDCGTLSLISRKCSAIAILAGISAQFAPDTLTPLELTGRYE